MKIDIYKNIKKLQYKNTNSQKLITCDLESWKKSLEYFKNNMLIKSSSLCYEKKEKDINYDFLYYFPPTPYINSIDYINILNNLNIKQYELYTQLLYINAIIKNEFITSYNNTIIKQYCYIKNKNNLVLRCKLDELLNEQKVNVITNNKIKIIEKEDKFESILLLSPEVTNILIEILVHAIQYKNIISRQSKLYNFFGKKIINERVSLTIRNFDNKYDDEGTKNNIIKIIENGILKRYLTSNYDKSIFNVPLTGFVFHKKDNIEYNTNFFYFESPNKCDQIFDNKVTFIEYGRLLNFNIRNGNFKLLVLQAQLLVEGNIKGRYSPRILEENIYNLLNRELIIQKKNIVIRTKE